MKNVILMLVLFFIAGQDFSAKPGLRIEEVPIGGSWEELPSLKSASLNPTVTIKVDLTGLLLTITSSTQQPDITVCISINGETQLEETIPAAESPTATIDLSQLAKGEYLLELANPSGGYLYGYLNLE
jgi:hypothetical protein